MKKMKILSVTVVLIAGFSLFLQPIDAFAASRLRRTHVSRRAPTPIVTVAPISPVISAPLSVTSATRALWVWGASAAIVSDSRAQDEFFSFIAAPGGDASLRINRLYFFGDNLGISSNPAPVRAFLRRAHQSGIAVEYLTGDAAWALPGMGYNATARVDKVIAFNTGATDERFDGIHFDIEPYLLAEWNSNRASVSANFVNILKESRAKITASGQNLSLAADIPTWYSFTVPEIWQPITVADTPLSNATIMNYFDSKANFLFGYGGADVSGGIGPNLRASGALPLTFGAETGITDPSTTFFEEGRTALAETFAAAAQTYSGTNGFGGLAIHHFDSLRSLK